MAITSSLPSGRGPGQRRGEPRRPGQWKLAYADFLTALMAFFLLMWLSADASVEDRAAIAAYFSGEDIETSSVNELPLSTASLLQVQADIEAAFSGLTASSGLNEHVQIHAEEDLLRIEVSDLSGRPLFDRASAQLTDTGERTMALLGSVAKLHPIGLSIEGHTDAFTHSGDIAGNWTLSSERADSAVRAMLNAGTGDDQILSVAGFADTQPLLPTQPHAAANRRISLVLKSQ